MLPGMAKLTTSHLIDLSAAPVPDWVELLPAGEFSGRDGRGPYVADTAQILAAFTAGAIPLPIDYEHQSLLAEDNGQPAPAAGWITEFDVRDRALWGHVEWTDRAAAHIAAREYRFLSPVFCYEQRTGVVVSISSAGLTNTPNLYLTALNRRDSHSPQEETRMDEMLERLRYMLNLPTLATQAEISAQLEVLISRLKAPETAAMKTALALPEEAGVEALLTAAQARVTAPPAAPDLSAYIPRAQYEEVAHALNTLKTAAENERVEREVTAAMSARKIAPASADWAREYCRRDAAGFAQFVASAPELLADTSHTQAKPQSSDQKNPLVTDAELRTR